MWNRALLPHICFVKYDKSDAPLDEMLHSISASVFDARRVGDAEGEVNNSPNAGDEAMGEGVLHEGLETNGLRGLCLS